MVVKHPLFEMLAMSAVGANVSPRPSLLPAHESATLCPVLVSDMCEAATSVLDGSEARQRGYD
eukprot:2412066-Rhodomonas_salina.3